MKRSNTGMNNAMTLNGEKRFQAWETPPWLIDFLEHYYDIKFVLDVACTADNALFSSYITEEEDALNGTWRLNGCQPHNAAAYCNPPYNEIRPWIDKAIRENMLHGLDVFLMLPARTTTEWFRHIVRCGAHIAFIPFCIAFGKHGSFKVKSPFGHVVVRISGHDTIIPGNIVVLPYDEMIKFKEGIHDDQ